MEFSDTRDILFQDVDRSLKAGCVFLDIGRNCMGQYVLKLICGARTWSAVGGKLMAFAFSLGITTVVANRMHWAILRKDVEYIDEKGMM